MVQELSREKGGAALDDPNKDLLRSVGMAEANRFANQGDEAEAKKYGFSAKNFGAGFAQEQAAAMKEKKMIEAKLSSTYDVTVNLQDDHSLCLHKTQRNAI